MKTVQSHKRRNFPQSLNGKKKQIDKNTHEKDDVDDDENIFDEVDAATVRVAILWFLYFDLFLRLLLARICAASTAVVVIVVVMIVGRAILG